MQDLDKFKNEMNLSGKNVYVGHRYVPKIIGEWDNTQIYEPLSIVQYQGASYTSRQYVPVGIEITNEDFWVVTGNYNAQVEQYRQEVRTFDNRINENETSIVTLDEKITETGETLDEKITENANVIDVYVSPENFDSLDECIQYAKDNNKYIKADSIVLTKHTNMRGVGLEIDFIDLNGFQLEIGAYNPSYNGVNDYRFDKGNNPTQTIKKIIGVHNNTNQLFVRGSSYQIINIDSYNGYIQITMNDKDDGVNRFNAYSTFNFQDIRGIEIKEDNDAGNIDPSMDLWANENTFNLGNCLGVYIGDVGGYQHNMNTFNGGTFEGNSRIKILSGQSNRFYHIRGEGNLVIELGYSTRFNRIETTHYIYKPTVNYDRGYGNKIINTTDEDNILILQDGISTNNILSDNYSDGDNKDLLRSFKNIKFAATESNDKFFKKDDRELATDIFYETPFLRNPKNIRFLVTGSVRTGQGFGVGYKYYDENFNDITNEIKTVGYILTTAQSFKGVAGGASRGPSGGLNMYLNHASVETPIYKSDILNWLPHANWGNESLNNQFNRIKYVKFFVGQTELSGDLSFYDLNIRVFDISGNMHTEYLQNYYIN